MWGFQRRCRHILDILEVVVVPLFSLLMAEASLARTGQEYFAIPAGFVVKSPARNHGFLLRIELGLPGFL
jgi:hypothetical protein